MKKIIIIAAIMALFISLYSVSYADGNTAIEQYSVGMEYFEKQDYTRAFAYFQMSGEIKKYGPAQKMLGVCYRDGLGVNPNPEQAEKYFKLAAEQGYSEATSKPTAQETDDSMGMKNIEIGSYISFGAYEQDNNDSNGKESLEWLVLATEKEKALLISKYVIDYKQYNAEVFDHADPYVITWETCSLRSWLNDDFLNDAFNNEEQAEILESIVSADKNPESNSNPGNQTQDKIFLLSIQEAKKYFSTDSERICSGTEYCNAKGSSESGRGTNWWLRTPGENSPSASYVRSRGAVHSAGVFANSNSGVRPALWITLKNIIPGDSINNSYTVFRNRY